VDARGAAGAEDGVQAASTASWLRSRLRLGAGAASSCVRTARALCRGPLTQTGQALTDGAITPAHASVVASGTQELPTLEGLLEPEAGQIVLAALEPLARPASAADAGSGGQRHGDALTELARRALEGGGCPRPVGSQLLVTVELASLLDPHGGVGGDTGWAGPLAPETCRRLACDGAVTRVVTPGQRHALAVRDGGCVVPDCQRPLAGWEAQHRWHWLDGGPTDLANLVLWCREHHRAVHEGGWQLTRQPDGRPTATPPQRSHRRHPHHRRHPTAT
jgi:hypothetical protein